MSHDTDVVAYTYQADILCKSCTYDALLTDWDSWRGPEYELDVMAERLGIDRYDERTYDSDDFPKVVFSSSANDTSWEHCGKCHDCIDHDLSDCEEGPLEHHEH